MALFRFFLLPFLDILGRGLLSPVHGIFGWSLFWFETMYTPCITFFFYKFLFSVSFLFPLMRLLALALEMLPLEIFCTLPMARA